MSTMKWILGSIASSLLFASSALAQTDTQQALTCAIPSTQPTQLEKLVEPRSAEESARLQHAPHATKRLAKHELQIGWSSGHRLFKDKPPFLEGSLDGLVWIYCGYSPALELHLIGKNDEQGFTGTLVDDAKGSLLPGGESVLFSPNRKLYIAYSQPDGQDGETLSLYTRSGSLLWQGYNGFLSPDGTILGNFENLHWDLENKLIAEITPNSQKKNTVALTHRNGKWKWVPITNLKLP